MTYEHWEADVPEEIRADTLWKVEAYRLSLFLSDLVWPDTTVLMRDRRLLDVADQLYRAAAKVSASVAEGYSRDTGKARSTFYEYALGSARETRDWYYKSRRKLRSAVVKHRIQLCTQIIKLLLKMIATERRTNRRPSVP
jgi:four helix bundle protein